MTGLAAEGAEVGGVPLEIVFLAAAGVVLVGVAAVRVSSRLGLPSLLLYLGIGVAIGEDGLGLRFDDAALSQTLGLAALVVILTEGGLTTRWIAVRPAVPLAVALSTIGVAVSVAVTASAAVVLLDTSWRAGLLLGAIVSSTDAAAVFSTLRVLGLPARLTATLEMESGFNDAPVIILVTLLSSDSTGSPLEILGLVAYELVVGAIIGLGVAFAAAWLLRRGALPAAGLYPLSVLAVAIGSYALATVAHASGFLAAYLTGLVLGNVQLPHRHATLGFVEGLAWLAQIGLFVLLGLLVSPSRLGPALLPALGLGAALLLLARPLSVLASAVWFRVRWAEQVFVSWAGLRGAVPIVLATIPLTAGVPEARAFFDTVFVLVLVFTLVQGTTLAPLARALKLSSDSEPRDLEVDSAPLEDLDADLLQVRIPASSRMHGVLVRELRLPEGAALSLLVRGGEGMVPGPDTRLRRGDQLLVVTTSPARAATERRLRAVGRAGRLASWLGEGPASPRTPAPGSAGGRTPPGAAGGRAPPGAAGGRTPPGAAGGRTPPGAPGGRTPPDGAEGRTPPGGASRSAMPPALPREQPPALPREQPPALPRKQPGDGLRDGGPGPEQRDDPPGGSALRRRRDEPASDGE